MMPPRCVDAKRMYACIIGNNVADIAAGFVKSTFFGLSASSVPDT